MFFVGSRLRPDWLPQRKIAATAQGVRVFAFPDMRTFKGDGLIEHIAMKRLGVIVGDGFFQKFCKGRFLTC